jgi:hypothetical protein
VLVLVLVLDLSQFDVRAPREKLDYDYEHR